MKIPLISSAAGGVDFIIAGLGNPGKKYEKTRHNCGYMVADKIAENNSVKINRLKFQSLCVVANFGEKKVLIMKPATFMNLSGEAVCAAMDYYKIPPERTLIICDDIYLEPGIMRIRKKGGHGGQNGMRHIIYTSDSENFPRIKIGIGAKPNPDYELADWVLSRFSSTESKKTDAAISDAALAAELIVQGKIEEATSKYSH